MLCCLRNSRLKLYIEQKEEDNVELSLMELERRATKKVISPDCESCSFSCTQFMINPIKVKCKRDVSEKIKTGDIVHIVGFQNRQAILMVLVQEDGSWHHGHEFEFLDQV